MFTTKIPGGILSKLPTRPLKRQTCVSVLKPQFQKFQTARKLSKKSGKNESDSLWISLLLRLGIGSGNSEKSTATVVPNAQEQRTAHGLLAEGSGFYWGPIECTRVLTTTLMTSIRLSRSRENRPRRLTELIWPGFDSRRPRLGRVWPTFRSCFGGGARDFPSGRFVIWTVLNACQVEQYSLKLVILTCVAF